MVKRIFFYGLFMDASLLQQLGLHPRVIGRAELSDFRILIGNRATLIPRPGSASYGIIMDLPDDEAASLYAGDDVRDYRPQTVTAMMIDDGSLQESLCYNLPADTSGSEKNVEYAGKLADLVLKLGFSPSYADEILVASND